VLSRPGFAGAMTFSLPEAIFLISEGITDDALMGYPTVDSAGLSALAEEPHLRQGITLMVDHPAHIDLLASLPRQGEAPFQVCIDVDASLKLGPLHIGVRRSPLRTPAQARDLARYAADRG